jgi:cephalosporin hydroxylase
MKDHLAQAGAKVTLENNSEKTTVDLYSKEGRDLIEALWLKLAAEQKVMYEPRWLGIQLIQMAEDLVATQEVIWKTKPDLIVETGIAHGGSLVLSASILELIGRGHVLGIDVEIRDHNRKNIDAHPLRKRIDMIEGSSIAPEVVAQVRKHAEGAKSVLVFLDSNHSTSHVAAELEAYAPLVTPGSYIVAGDGAQAYVSDIPRGKPEWKNDNPLIAIHDFLKRHPEFEIDHSFERFGACQSPDGYLRRIS